MLSTFACQRSVFLLSPITSNHSIHCLFLDTGGQKTALAEDKTTRKYQAVNRNQDEDDTMQQVCTLRPFLSSVNT